MEDEEDEEDELLENAVTGNRLEPPQVRDNRDRKFRREAPQMQKFRRLEAPQIRKSRCWKEVEAFLVYIDREPDWKIT
jgi:hypothetical protein